MYFSHETSTFFDKKYCFLYATGVYDEDGRSN